MIDSIIIRLDSFVAFINPILYELVASMLIIFTGFIIGRIVSNLLKKFLRDVDTDTRTKDFVSFNKSFAERTAKITRISIYTLSVILALIFLDILFITGILLAICFLVVIVFSTVFFIRDFLPNTMNWFKIRKKVFEGKEQVINKEKGLVIKKTIFSVHIRKKNKDYLIFPNRIIKHIQTEKKVRA